MAHQTSERGSWNGSRSRNRGSQSKPTAQNTAYQLGQRLASGSTGEVYEASHPWLPGRFVVKVVSPGLSQLRHANEAFLRELTTISSLRHPNIVQVVEVGELPQDGRPFVVMERLEGRALETRLRDGRPLPSDEAVALIKGVAGALQAAHSRGVFHCELHPGNIFLAAAEGHENGFPKLLNFGIARLRNASGGDAGVGAEEARYMAPEQAQGRTDAIDGRTDEFALATIAYRLLCGVDAFRGSDPIRVLYQVVHEEPEPMSSFSVGARIEEVVLRALSKRETERFDSVLEFARALEEAVASGVSEHDRVTPVRRAAAMAPTARRGPVLVPAGRRGEDTPEVPVGQAPRQAVETPPERPRPRARSFGSGQSGGMALPGGGVLVDEPMWGDPGIDDFDDLERVPRQRGRIALFLIAFAVVCVVAAFFAGWSPPLAWRQSRVWHALHLPRAAGPTEPMPTPPAPPAPATAGGENFPASAAPPPVTGAPAPAPSAPATAAAGGSLPAKAPAAAPAREAPVAEAPAAQAPAAPATATAPEPAAEPAPRTDRRPPAKEPPARARSRHETRENIHLRGVVWSEKEQRLVPVDSAGASPASAPTPSPTPAPPPAAKRPVAPGDAPMPLSPTIAPPQTQSEPATQPAPAPAPTSSPLNP